MKPSLRREQLRRGRLRSERGHLALARLQKIVDVRVLHASCWPEHRVAQLTNKRRSQALDISRGRPAHLSAPETSPAMPPLRH